MRILVLGGSYFTGRVYVQRAARAGEELWVVNRGRFPLRLPGVTEYRCDRHEPEKVAEGLPPGRFDALVDFCAYGPGDVAGLLKVLGGRIGHYILFSTASLYRLGETAADETAPFGAFPPGAVGEYLRGKAAVEGELTAQGKVPWTILRPAFLYGPYNYAPRESWMIRQIVAGQPLPYPRDATGHWSFVYVEDAARAVARLAGERRAYGQVYNLSAPEKVDYSMLFQLLEQNWGKPFPCREVTCREVERESIPLPFPLEEELCYDGSKLTREMGVRYTSLEEGFRKTFCTFRAVFEKGND